MAILKKKTDTPPLSEGQKATTEKELLPYAPFQEEGVTGGRSGYSLQDNVRWLRSGNGDGVTVHKIDREFPSSQTCTCGHV